MSMDKNNQHWTFTVCDVQFTAAHMLESSYQPYLGGGYHFSPDVTDEKTDAQRG